jgi:ABC-type phosphate transport system, periplasmic component
MRQIKNVFLLTLMLLTACGLATPAATLQTISVEYTGASIPWLAVVTNCAGGNVVDSQQIAADFQDSQSFDLTIRIGHPENLVSPAFQIGSEEILVIENPQNQVKVLTAEQVKKLFTGQISNWKDLGGSDTSVQVWTFPPGEDIQQVFDKEALGGSPLTSSARLATSPDEMEKAIANDVNAVGVQPRRWKGSNVLDTFTTSTIPVLVLTKADPQMNVQNVIACLQNKVP